MKPIVQVPSIVENMAAIVRSSWSVEGGIVWRIGEKMPRQFREAARRARLGLPTRQRYARRARQPKAVVPIPGTD